MRKSFSLNKKSDDIKTGVIVALTCFKAREMYSKAILPRWGGMGCNRDKTGFQHMFGRSKYDT